MLTSVRVIGLGLLLTAAVACRHKPTDPAAAAPPFPADTTVSAASNATVSAPLTPTDPTLTQKIQGPRVGDVYVVAYQPGGSSAERYFFYRVSQVDSESVNLLPARQESSNPDTDVSTAGFFTDKALTYTRAQALELMQEQPGDVQHTRLVQIRR